MENNHGSILCSYHCGINGGGIDLHTEQEKRLGYSMDLESTTIKY